MAADKLVVDQTYKLVSSYTVSKTVLFYCVSGICNKTDGYMNTASGKYRSYTENTDTWSEELADGTCSGISNAGEIQASEDIIQICKAPDNSSFAFANAGNVIYFLTTDNSDYVMYVGNSGNTIIGKPKPGRITILL